MARERHNTVKLLENYNSNKTQKAEEVTANGKIVINNRDEYSDLKTAITHANNGDKVEVVEKIDNLQEEIKINKNITLS